jgi:FAD/FMN-containing dehydrogenase
MATGTCWSRWPRYSHHIVPLKDRFEPLPESSPQLPFGNGRSYGDVCLNADGTLLETRGLDRLIAFDSASGILECEAGVLLSEIIAMLLPRGWLPAVSPGTAFVTVGGAIANDVHGKNHHRLGTFGHHVLELELARSDGKILLCSANANPDLFRATIGGLGLTGLIRKARLQLRAVTSPWIEGNSRRFGSLKEFFELADSANDEYEYTVAWLDCAAQGRSLGRGIFTCGNHAQSASAQADSALGLGRARAARTLRVPVTPPLSPVCRTSVRLFNSLYYHRRAAEQERQRWHYQEFQFPLDRVLDWNRLYGPRGFFQYQCAIPDATARDSLTELVKRIAGSHQGSVLSVLKKFGPIPSRGLMSFARPGFTLALDFPNRGAPTLQLLESLDAVTRAAGGAVYPAKDARMSASSFRQYFPAWEEFQRYIDPKFSSSFWRRVTERSG